MACPYEVLNGQRSKFALSLPRIGRTPHAQRPGLLRERLVRTITKHAVAALLAGAEIDRAVFLGGVRHRGEAGVLMRSVTERLGFALSAGAPVVGLSSFDGDGNGRCLGDLGSIHVGG